MTQALGGFKLSILVIIILIFSGCSPYFHQVKYDSGTSYSGHIHEILHQDYPFEEHKKVNLSSLADSLDVLVQSEKFDEGRYLSMKQFAFSIPDSRISLISGKDKKLKKEETGGYIGFDIAFVPTGEYFVSKIDSTSEAWSKGLRPGYKIIGWNQKLIAEAVESFPLRWGFHPGTDEYRKLLACHFITRGMPGSSAEVFFENDQENNKGIKLKFLDCHLIDYPEMTGVIKNQDKKKFEFNLLNDSLGYFKIDQFTPSGLKFFNRSVVGALSNLSGLIIDLRESTGGYDPIAVKMAGHFISQSRFYEKAFIKEGDDIHVITTQIADPESLIFSGNIIILTGPMTMGVAEGFAGILQEENHISLLGCWDTAASFSLPGGRIKLGNGISLLYPIGGSLDENNEIQIESGEWQKGIHPDIHIPANKEMSIQIANGVDILLWEAVHHIWR